MYVGDERFKNNIDKPGGDGTADLDFIHAKQRAKRELARIWLVLDAVCLLCFIPI